MNPVDWDSFMLGAVVGVVTYTAVLFLAAMVLVHKLWGGRG